MNWTESSTNLNTVLRKAVDAQTRCGKNWMGAVATLADWLNVSPQLIRRRYYDEITREPHSRNKMLAAKAWEFLAMLAEKERAWVETLAKEVEQNRLRLRTDLNVEDRKTGDSTGNRSANARRMARDEVSVAAARQALGEFEEVRQRALHREGSI